MKILKIKNKKFLYIFISLSIIFFAVSFQIIIAPNILNKKQNEIFGTVYTAEQIIDINIDNFSLSKERRIYIMSNRPYFSAGSTVDNIPSEVIQNMFDQLYKIPTLFSKDLQIKLILNNIEKHYAYCTDDMSIGVAVYKISFIDENTKLSCIIDAENGFIYQINYIGYPATVACLASDYTKEIKEAFNMKTYYSEMGNPYISGWYFKDNNDLYKLYACLDTDNNDVYKKYISILNFYKNMFVN